MAYVPDYGSGDIGVAVLDVFIGASIVAGSFVVLMVIAILYRWAKLIFKKN